MFSTGAEARGERGDLHLRTLLKRVACLVLRRRRTAFAAFAGLANATTVQK